jgi:hypothetical protein
MSGVFEKTNPHITFKRRYKKILSDSNCYRAIVGSHNIFDPQDEQNRRMVATRQTNPEEVPLGGHKYF